MRRNLPAITSPTMLIDVPRNKAHKHKLGDETECTLTREQYRAYASKRAA